jgi:hypothetical protein
MCTFNIIICVLIVSSFCVLNFILPTCTPNFDSPIKSLSRSCLHYFAYSLSSDIKMEPALSSRRFLRLFETVRRHISETLIYASLLTIVMGGSTILNTLMCISQLQYRTSNACLLHIVKDICFCEF